MMRSVLIGAVLVLGFAALPASAGALTAFVSPSKNIHCVMSGGVRCDIRHKDWNAPKPRGCQLDWGQGLSVTRTGSRGRVVCAGDTVLGVNGRTLAYGRSVTRNRITCTSRTNGVTCRNPRGHGFRISKESYRLF